MELAIVVALMLTAFLYSSVGHGGASGYLALMALFAIETAVMRSSALTMNLFVAGISFISFYRGGHFKWNIFFPFAAASVPMAFLGAQTTINPTLYKIILGIFLLIAVARMLIRPNKEFEQSKNLAIIPALLIGAFLGFFSGMIGIGGGIILSPVLLVFHWANVKEAAGISALFILVNSLSGLIGLGLADNIAYPSYFPLWIPAVIIGGLMGGYSGSFKYSPAGLRYVLAGVLLMASFKLFIY